MGSVKETVKRFVPASVRREVRAALALIVALARQWVLKPLGIGVKLVPEAELRDACERALKVLTADTAPSELGDYVEFGVCHGTSMTCMARAADAVGAGGMRLIGFDSFEGLPEGVEEEDDGICWKAGDFASSEETARRNLKRAGVADDRYVLVKGWFDHTATPATAARLGVERVSLAMIDCDVYSSAVTSLAFLGPLLSDRSVLIFDDWNSGDLAAKGKGEKRAFDEFLVEHPEFEVVDELDPYTRNAHIVVVERH
jgi:O-methyltransferase